MEYILGGTVSSMLTEDQIDIDEVVEFVISHYKIQYTFQGKRISLGGITKGSGMIHPNMATMLGFLYTDAVIDSKTLKRALIEAADRSFNRITVDGDNSTNDCIIILANGEAKNSTIKPNTLGYREFLKALTKICINCTLYIDVKSKPMVSFI